MILRTTIRTTIVMLAFVALLFSLLGCAGSDDDANNNFAGRWDAVEVSDGAETFAGGDLEYLKELGFEAYLELNEDNTAVLSVFEEKIEGSWEVRDPDTAVFSADGESMELKLVDGRLNLEIEGSKIVFARIDSAQDSSDSSAQSTRESEDPAGDESGRLELAFVSVVIPEGWKCSERSDDYQVYIQDSNDADREFQFNIKDGTAQELLDSDMEFWGDRTRLEDKMYGFDTYLAAEFEWNGKPSTVLYIDRPGHPGESIQINCFEIDPEDPIIAEMLQWVQYL